MGLRKNQLLKYLSILLFTFGLIAPVAAPESIAEATNTHLGHHSVSPTTLHGAFTQFLLEENNEEERGTNGDKHPVLCLVANISQLNKLCASRADGFTSAPLQKQGPGPKLFQLYGSFLI